METCFQTVDTIWRRPQLGPVAAGQSKRRNNGALTRGLFWAAVLGQRLIPWSTEETASVIIGVTDAGGDPCSAARQRLLPVVVL